MCQAAETSPPPERHAVSSRERRTILGFGVVGFRVEGSNNLGFGVVGFRVEGYSNLGFGVVGFRVEGYRPPTLNPKPHLRSSMSQMLGFRV